MREWLARLLQKINPIWLFAGIIVLVICLGVSCSAMAQDESKCELYVRAGMYGATQQMRGAAREIVYIDRSMLIEMIEHGLGGDRIYFFNDPAATDEDKAYNEMAVYNGYDKMAKWKEKHGDEMPHSEQWSAAFMAECMKRSDS